MESGVALSLLRDPYSNEEFAGGAEELVTVGGYLRATDELRDRVRRGGGGPTRDARINRETEADPKAKSKAKRPKGRGKRGDHEEEP
jgi:hypothetical protein